MEDDNGEVEAVDFNSVRYRVEKLDRGSYIVLTVFSSDLDDPCGSFTFSKSDPNCQNKMELIRTVVVAWMNDYIGTGKYNA